MPSAFYLPPWAFRFKPSAFRLQTAGCYPMDALQRSINFMDLKRLCMHTVRIKINDSVDLSLAVVLISNISITLVAFFNNHHS